MNAQVVREVLDLIRDRAGDPEAAHSTEDELWNAVLRAIAEGTCDDPAQMARLALSSREIEFARWYA